VGCRSDPFELFLVPSDQTQIDALSRKCRFIRQSPGELRRHDGAAAENGDGRHCA
jgi:hypothetical protein